MSQPTKFIAALALGESTGVEPLAIHAPGVAEVINNAAALVIRDLLILAGGLYLKSARRVVLPSNAAGKWTATLIAFTILMVLLNLFREMQWIMLAACAAGLLLSFVLYIARFLQVLREARA